MSFKSFPTLYKKNSKGAVQYWTICVLEDPNHPLVNNIETKYGQVGGAEQVASDSIKEGKNLGKANSTTPFEQACSEAESRWTKQVERKGYVTDLSLLDTDSRPGAEPMLAHRFDKYPEKIVYPCAVQPKLDGHRCIAVFDGTETKLFSRQRKPITGLPHVETEITNLLRGKVDYLILDGELYNHEYKNNFEELTSHIRSETPKEGHTLVQYHLYDTVAPSTFKERIMKLGRLLGNYSGTILQPVKTDLADSQEDVIEAFNTCRNDGYEGAILRNLDGEYVGKRSYDLLKVKSFLDDEFPVVGVEDGRGKMAGHAIFVCKTKEGKEFRAKMKGDMDRLAEYFQNASKYVGKTLTVQFQDYTKDGIPRFPVALRFREDV